MKPSLDDYSPSHPGLFTVEFTEGHLTSSLKALKVSDQPRSLSLLN